MFFSISFLVRYLGEQAYGVWILVFSFFQWGLYFDFGISNVLKSKIPELISKNENHKINLFISESIKLTTLISIVLFLICLFFILFFNLSSIFNIGYKEVFIKQFFLTNLFFFCINFILSINKSLFIGVLNPKISEKSASINQFVFLISIVIIFLSLDKISIINKLWIITVINGLSTTFVNSYYLYLFFEKKNYTINLFNKFNYVISKEILFVGVKFMAIQTFMAIIFFSDPYFISAYSDPKTVSLFDILNKLFQMPLLIMLAGISSFWPFFSQNYHSKNYFWFNNIFKKFETIFLIISLIVFLFAFLSPYIINFWIGDKYGESIQITLLILMAFIIMFRVYFTFYLNFLNGINRLNSQIIVMGFTAIIKIPLTIYILKNGFGLNGLFFQLLLFMLSWSIIFKIESLLLIRKMKNEK